MRLIDADAIQIPKTGMEVFETCRLCETTFSKVVREIIDNTPTIEPNLILPEQMGRGDIYEVGETIVVMNHDDYYDLLCKSIEPKRGEWIPCSKKMPNEGDRIVVQYADGSLGLINSCRMRIWTISNSPYSKVVAWMYIEPWKGADDEV